MVASRNKWERNVSKQAALDRQNRAAAKVILERARPGDTGLATEWAKRILGKADER